MQKLPDCCGCGGRPLCLKSRIEGDVLYAPTAEHCAITRVGDDVRKYLKPWANLTVWQARQQIAEGHPDLFVPFQLEGRVVIQAFVAGEPGMREDMQRIGREIVRRGLPVYDHVAKNIVAGRLIDFAVPTAAIARRP